TGVIIRLIAHMNIGKIFTVQGHNKDGNHQKPSLNAIALWLQSIQRVNSIASRISTVSLACKDCNNKDSSEDNVEIDGNVL
ncbi:11615_t:CDS:2, partial [Dentiscutata heterogama]